MDILAFFITCLGALLGSFIGVLVERIHTGQSWVQSRSRCNSCARDLGVPDLVPVLSWLCTFGRCRTCTAHVPALYVITEVTLAALFFFAYQMLGASLSLALLLFVLLVLAFIVLYDLRHTVVPPVASALLLISSLAFAYSVAPSLASFGAALFSGGVIGLAFLLAFALSRGRAMGLGDAPVALSLSLVAAPYAFSGLLFSFWIGAVVGIVILFMRRGGPRMGIEVPFVPFLAAGFLLAYFSQWNLFPL